MRILVVDDEPAILALLADFLAEEGHAVTGVTNGREALESAQRACPDLVLTDVTMPVMDGLQLSLRLHADDATCHVPVVVMSATRPLRLAAFGAFAFVDKPLDFARLCGIIASCMPAIVPLPTS